MPSAWLVGISLSGRKRKIGMREACNGERFAGDWTATRGSAMGYAITYLPADAVCRWGVLVDGELLSEHMTHHQAVAVLLDVLWECEQPSLSEY